MFQWYVINTYSGHENKVKANLEHRIDSMNQRVRFRRVVVPGELRKVEWPGQNQVVQGTVVVIIACVDHRHATSISATSSSTSSSAKSSSDSKGRRTCSSGT